MYSQVDRKELLYFHNIGDTWVPVVGGGDGSEPLLTRRVPDLQLDLLTVQLDRANLEINACKKKYWLNPINLLYIYIVIIIFL